jgi:UDP-N-acetylmuramoyl-L-alanyl-D-glutamate--2,6-diaminopimelate ligase
VIQLNNPTEAVNWLRANVKGELRIDSRDIQMGDGFIAWPGAAVDGRQYVKSALQKGATACLVEHAGLEAKGYLVEYKKIADKDKVASYLDLKNAIGNIAAQAYNTPARALNVIAFTGTNGKTTSAWWLAQALSALAINSKTNTHPQTTKCFMVGTLGIGVPNAVESTGLTTPDPIMLHKKFREYVDHGFTYCAIEASSIGIEEHRLYGTDIKVAVFTNFTQDHLDYHGSMQSYWQAKLKLFQWSTLKAAVINIDDLKGQELVEILNEKTTNDKSLDIWTVAIDNTARLKAFDISYSKNGLQFSIIEDNDIHFIETKFVGKYNVSNLLGVIAAMRASGIVLMDCVEACKSLTAVPGRMDMLTKEGQPLVIVDYAHTPDALKQALISLRPVANSRMGKLICIFGCGGNRDAGKRPLMASMAEEYSDIVVVTADNSRNEKIESILDNIIVGFKTKEKFTVEENRAAAIAKSIKSAQAKDVILIAGKGHENYQDEYGVKTYFSDKEQAWHEMTKDEVVA